MRRVVVTGSESTGKTTLARDLARRFGTVWVPEYARTYYEEKRAATGEPLDATDVEPIARGQIAAEHRAVAEASSMVPAPPFIVLDTDVVSTTVYARHYYGSCPDWIDLAARERLAELYLLCDVDVPWVPGPPRDLPHLREHMHGLFEAALISLGARYVVVRGGWAERLRTAIAAVGSQL